MRHTFYRKKEVVETIWVRVYLWWPDDLWWRKRKSRAMKRLRCKKNSSDYDDKKTGVKTESLQYDPVSVLVCWRAILLLLAVSEKIPKIRRNVVEISWAFEAEDAQIELEWRTMAHVEWHITAYLIVTRWFGISSHNSPFFSTIFTAECLASDVKAF